MSVQVDRPMDDPDASITATQSINRFTDEPTEANRRPLVLALCTERVYYGILWASASPPTVAMVLYQSSLVLYWSSVEVR